MNFYEILGLEKTASDEEIKKAYRKKAFQSHPDRNPGDKEAEQKFKDVQSAYDVLSNPQKRREYDQFGRVGPQHRGHTHSSFDFEFSDIFEQFFGGSRERGHNVQIRLEISLQDVLTGIIKEIPIKQKAACGKCTGSGFSTYDPCQYCNGTGRTSVAQAPFSVFVSCQACRGTGRHGGIRCNDCVGTGLKPEQEKTLRIKIPAGVENGMHIRIPGEGEPGRNGSRSGDVIVTILIKDHEVFKREGSDLVTEFFLSYIDLVLGKKINIKSLDDKDITFEIPPGTPSHSRLRLKKQGLPRFQGSGKGDLIVVAKVKVPTQISAEYRKKLHQLQELENK